MDWLRYANQGAVRNQQLSDRLVNALSFVPEMGLQMEVFSGGQPRKGTSSRRVGSVRHDDGNAADVFFHKDGRRLDWGNPDDLPIFEEIVRKSRGAGITGIGAGPGYMRQGSMHIGFGTPVVWGAGGRSKNAPEWLRNAYYGAEPGTVPAAPATPAVQMAGQPGQSAPANDPTPMLMAMFGGAGQSSAMGRAGADVPIPNAAPVAAPQPAPMRSMAPTPVQGQTAALAPTVAERSGMAKTVSTTLAPTPQQIAQRQAMANALAQQSDEIEVIRHPLQGVDKVAKSALAGFQRMRAGQQEQARSQGMADVIGGMADGTGRYSQEQISQAAALEPNLAMGMIQQNRAIEAATAERARTAPLDAAKLEAAQLANEQARIDIDNSKNPVPEAPTTRAMKLSDGSEVGVQWDGTKLDPKTGKPGVWVPMNAPEGGRAVSDRVKLTESQSKLTLFQSMQQETAPALNDLETMFNPANLPDFFAGNVLGGNFYRSREGQMYESAATAWAEGALRIATGAAATPEEMQRTLKAYFAQPGDTPETIRWKSHLREMYARSIQRGLGSTNIPERLPKPSEFLKNFQDAGINDLSAVADDLSVDDLLQKYGGQ